MAKNPRPESSTLRRWALNLLALALPFAVLALVEGLLRWSGYGHEYPLFVPVPADSAYLYQNPDVARRYFKRQERVPTGLHDYFKVEKDTNTFRIFVQGGSTAAGYPLYYGGSFSRMLEQRLLQTFPGRNIEVINTAMAAVNSYTLLDFADEIIEREPDLILIYAGHNEYYGSLGVGSTESLGSFRPVINLYLRWQHLRLMQLLEAGLLRLASRISSDAGEAARGGTLMSRLVREQEIPYGSRLYHRGIDQFSGNMAALLKRYRSHGIPVMIGTLASNERDQEPFVSRRAPGVDEAVWAAEMAGARRALIAGDTAQALLLLDATIQIDSTAAQPFFVKGRILESRSAYEAARRAYLDAKDRDQLRFRAPEAMNEQIRRLATEFGAVLVETRERIRRRAPHGIIGRESMLEHLHPNVDGYFAMADALYEAVRTEGLIGDWSRPVPAERARRELLFTAVDSLVGQYRVIQLMNSWPFQPAGTPGRMAEVHPQNEVEAIAYALYRSEINWYTATDRLITHYESAGDLHNALRAALAIVQEYPFIAPPYLRAGAILARQGRLDEALNYFEAALEREPSAAAYQMMAGVLLQQRNPSRAVELLEKARSLAPDDPDVLYRLAATYLMNRQAGLARDVLEQLLAINPDHAEGQALLGQFGARP